MNPKGRPLPDLLDDASVQTEVIHHEEAARAGAFGRGTALLSFIGILVAVVVGMIREVPLWERFQTTGPSVVLFVVGMFVWWRSRDVERYSRWTFRVFALVCGVCALELVYTMGTFSPMVVIIVLGLAFFVHGRDPLIIPGALALIAAYMMMGILVTARILPDRGIWRESGLSQHLAMTVMVTSVMVTQVVLARSNRRALEEAVKRARAAMRVARVREAQLNEVRESLDVALGAGNGGRLTGAVLGGWRVGDIVGRGAMGEVYAARLEDGDRLAAIKVLRAPDDELIAKRFVREAEISSTVRGPNLVEVFGTGRAPDGSLYIAMELLAGRDLAAILRERITLPLEEVAVLVEETARGLTVLHAAGVVHRDLKPQNLFRAMSETLVPSWKILDYGVSKLVGAGTMTEHDLVGTPGYMSPEQAEGKDVDARSDIFSLGTVVYRALTGQRPFSGSSTMQLLYQVVHGTPTRVRELVPSIPKEVEEVVSVALEKNPANRFQTALDFAAALRAAVKASRLALPASHVNDAKKGRVWPVEAPTMTIPQMTMPMPKAGRNGARDDGGPLDS